MQPSKKTLLISAIGVLLLFFSSCDLSPVPSRIEGVAMTVGYCVQIGDPKPDLEEVERLILLTFSQIDQIYNSWNPTSEVSQLNKLKANVKQQLSAPLSAFLHKIDALVRFTEGRFDPTIAPIKKDLIEGHLCKKIVSIGWDKVHLKGDFFYKDDDDTAIDLDGAVKGYAVDLIIERLKKVGYNNLCVEWGGELRTTGLHPQGRPWNISIYGGETIEIQEAAIATSGSYFQRWEREGVLYTHIIDPWTKKPIKAHMPITSVSVLNKNCFEADALATALMLFPSKEDAYAWAKKHNFIIWIY